jgi:acyl-CoA thioesterase I
MMGWVVLLLLVLSVVHLPAASAGPEGAPPVVCPSSADAETPDQPLDNLAAAARSGGLVDVLALGSANTVASGKAGYPYAMLQALTLALPHTRWRLTVQGGRGRTAADLLEDLRAALKRQHFALVVWQTGTVEAVRGIRPEELQDVLEEGAAMIEGQGGNLVLIDPQFSRFLRANTDIDAYEQAIAAAAELPGADLFRRFDLMHGWAEDGSLDLERTAAAEQPAVVSLLNQCVGRALARFVLNGIGR